MAGIGGVFKAGGGLKGPMSATGLRGMGAMKQHYKGVHAATWKPQPASGSADTRPTGPMITQMSVEEQEELRKRRAAQRRPTGTVLSSASSDEALGG